MSIKTKLILAIVSTLVLFSFLALISWNGRQDSINAASLSKAFDEEVAYLEMFFRGVNESILTEGTQDSIETAKRGMEEFDTIHKGLMMRVGDEALIEAVTQRIDPAWLRIKRKATPFLKLNDVNPNDDLLMASYGRMLTEREFILEEIRSLAGEARATYLATLASTKNNIFLATLLFIGGMVLLYLNLYRSIAIPINKLKILMSEIGENQAGMLDVHNLSSVNIQDEFYKLESGLLTRVSEIKSLINAFDSMIRGIEIHILKRKEVEEELRKMAHHDALTGLPNRALFFDRLEQLIALSKRKKQTFAILFIDLDGFKSVNDSFGHHVGDLLLKGVARLLISNVRQVDTVARMGGDEFTIILTDLPNKECAATVAAKLIGQVSQPFEIEKHSIKVGLSIGIAMYPVDSTDSNNLMNCADSAMYAAKKSGENNYKFV
jgi:diguanylate cyclase (GGDEF)-like protein